MLRENTPNRTGNKTVENSKDASYPHTAVSPVPNGTVPARAAWQDRDLHRLKPSQLLTINPVDVVPGLTHGVFHMARPLILASGSLIRAQMLRNAGLNFEVQTPRVDEDTVKAALLAEGAPPRDVADALAELKARKLSDRHPRALVLGCDQVLALGDDVLSKPVNRDDARSQLQRMRGQRHTLLSAAVLCEDGAPIWRHVAVVRLVMRDFTDTFLDDYLDRNWPGIADSVGAYKLEEEGVRLFSRIDGDFFAVLGLPLLELLSYLTLRGDIQK